WRAFGNQLPVIGRRKRNESAGAGEHHGLVNSTRLSQARYRQCHIGITGVVQTGGDDLGPASDFSQLSVQRSTSKIQAGLQGAVNPDVEPGLDRSRHELY